MYESFYYKHFTIAFDLGDAAQLTCDLTSSVKTSAGAPNHSALAA